MFSQNVSSTKRFPFKMCPPQNVSPLKCFRLKTFSTQNVCEHSMFPTLNGSSHKTFPNTYIFVIFLMRKCFTFYFFKFFKLNYSRR